jgi:hypothetical protein
MHRCILLVPSGNRNSHLSRKARGTCNGQRRFDCFLPFILGAIEDSEFDHTYRNRLKKVKDRSTLNDSDPP